jgi:hypothetical protein
LNLHAIGAEDLTVSSAATRTQNVFHVKENMQWNKAWRTSVWIGATARNQLELKIHLHDIPVSQTQFVQVDRARA